VALTTVLGGVVVAAAQTGAGAQPPLHAVASGGVTGGSCPSYDPCTLGYALFIGSGETIDLAQGTYLVDSLFIDESVNLVGAAENTTFLKGSDGPGSDAVVNIEDGTVMLSNLTITGGYSFDNEAGAGGIDNYDGILTLDNVNVTGNQFYDGAFVAGGIVNFNFLDLMNSSVTRNVAGEGERACAGGIINFWQMTMQSSIVSQNTCPGDFDYGVGGIFNIPYSDYELGPIAGPNASPNSTPGSYGTPKSSSYTPFVFAGGTKQAVQQKNGIANQPIGNTSIYAYQSTVTGNSSGGESYLDAGGIMNWATLFLSGVGITGNNGNGGEVACGGGLCNDGEATVVGGVVANNYSNAFGGGIYNGYELTMSGSGGVSTNTSDYGGGIFDDCDSYLSLANTSITSNFAYDDGGGIFFAVPEGTTSIAPSVVVSHNRYDDYDGGGGCTDIFGP